VDLLVVLAYGAEQAPLIGTLEHVTSHPGRLSLLSSAGR